MSNLKNLQKLDEFVVCKDGGANIKELGQLQHLRGFLRIESLENVVDVKDVSMANLKDKKRITALSLEWNSETGESRKAKEVLDGLKPNTNLEVLSIVNYGGTSLLRWVGDDSFSRIKSVYLIPCRNCCVLPPLGQLPSLEVIEGLDMLERIGDEFYSSSSSDGSCGSGMRLLPFESLKDLTFRDMPEWKEWWLMDMEGNNEEGRGSVFSNLKRLELESCPKLGGACLPEYLPALETIRIDGSSQPVASLSRCQYPPLDSLSISNCDEMESFPQGRLPSSIREIAIWGCRRLVSLSEEGWPSNLKSLSLSSCDGLFQRNTQWHLRTLTSLTSLEIHDMEVENPDPFLEEQQARLPASLTSLELSSLRNIKSLNGTAFRHLTSLQSLTIFLCDQLQGLPEGGLPTTLLSLRLWCLPSLESLDENTFRPLQKLEIMDCKNLQCLPELEKLPATLPRLEIF